jgi:hypothetical protein
MKQLFFENIYDKYTAALYVIALEICSDVECKEKVFTIKLNHLNRNVMT